MLLKHNIIAGASCYANYMHTPRLLRKYDLAVSEVFSKISKLNSEGKIEKNLLGPVKQMGFNRLTGKW